MIYCYQLGYCILEDIVSSLVLNACLRRWRRKTDQIYENRDKMNILELKQFDC